MKTAKLNEISLHNDMWDENQYKVGWCRSFRCHFISSKISANCSKKSFTLEPCSSCSQVRKTFCFFSSVRNSQSWGTGKTTWKWKWFRSKQENDKRTWFFLYSVRSIDRAEWFRFPPCVCDNKKALRRSQFDFSITVLNRDCVERAEKRSKRKFSSFLLFSGTFRLIYLIS